MWLLNRLLGFGLLLSGIGVLAQRLYVTTRGWTIEAPTTILCVIGIVIWVYAGEFKKFGLVPIVIGILIPFMKAGIAIASTTLLTFILCFLAITYGFRMITRGSF
ncbi:hypothetical protein [Brunnivagina elsteri]|uniref:LiaF transmembrane domain-containing protein n=1 Tax=Brunnivagina elsteri CCALA 953 TaxID=987040 RepID=A0A2A2THZ2_9CYAN|nr:hypothetical protein [Calothrix elsteri]PAX53353.1 hypothetical protein CK510_14495 [Calothrix elsteri CCALA 953]